MAEENDEQDQAATAEHQAKRKKLMLLGGVALVLLLVAGGASWLVLGMLGGGDEPVAEEHAAAEETAPAHQPALYFSLEAPLVANFDVGGRARYLQVSVTVLTREADVVEGLKTHAPLINNRLVILLSGERFSELQTHQGREQLRQKLLAAVQDILQRELGKPGAEQVLFTNFVMQ